MLPNKYMLTGIAVLVMVIGSVWYVTSLKGTISDQKERIELLDREKTNLEVEAALKTANVESLKSTIEKQNNKILQLKVSGDEIEAQLIKWKNQPVQIKYKDRIVEKVITKTLKPSDDICKDFIEITNNIKEIRYEDL